MAARAENSKYFSVSRLCCGVSNTLEHMLKRALKQSCNIIVDTSRMRNVRDDSTRRFLVNQVKMRRQIKKLLMISKRGQIIDISGLAR